MNLFQLTFYLKYIRISWVYSHIENRGNINYNMYNKGILCLFVRLFFYRQIKEKRNVVKKSEKFSCFNNGGRFSALQLCNM